MSLLIGEITEELHLYVGEAEAVDRLARDVCADQLLQPGVLQIADPVGLLAIKVGVGAGVDVVVLFAVAGVDLRDQPVFEQAVQRIVDRTDADRGGGPVNLFDYYVGTGMAQRRECLVDRDPLRGDLDLAVGEYLLYGFNLFHVVLYLKTKVIRIILI